MELPEFAADFSLVSFHQERITSEGAVAIHAGPGIPFAAVLDPTTAVSDIHQVSNLRPVSTFVENIRPHVSSLNY